MHQMTLPMGDDSGSDRGPTPVPVHVGNVPVNSSVSGEDQKRLSGQSRDILEALRKGPRLNTELITLPTADGRPRLIHNMTARISEIRNYLRPQGWDVQSYRLPEGIWVYRLGRRDYSQSVTRRIDIHWRADESAGLFAWKCPGCELKQWGELRPGDTVAEKEKAVVANPLCQKCHRRL